MLRLSIIAAATLAGGQLGPSSAADQLRGFNDAFASAIRRMDNAAILSLWDEDGIALLPHTAPVIGRAAIGKMMDSATAAHPNAKMMSFTNVCSAAEVAGDWGSEWCLEHQVVGENGKAFFNGWGKMLLVLHRNAAGQWRLKREMWNQADAPDDKSN